MLCFVLFALVLCTFARALQCDFQFYDEADYLLNNPHVNSGLSWSNFTWALFNLDKCNWYPLTWLSHMLDFNLFGTDPRGHHLINVLYHAANAVLLFLVMKRMTGTMWRSWMVAGLFALHPLRVESVAWISERKDVLSAFFWLLALWTYVRHTEECRGQGSGIGRWKYYGLTLLLFIFSLMSKAMAVTFPFVLLLLDYWPLGRWRTDVRRVWMEKIPFFLILPFVCAIFYLAQKGGGATTEMGWLPWEGRVENAFVSYARYLGKFFFPSNLCIYYPHPGFWPAAIVMTAFLLVAGVSILAWQTRRRVPWLFVGWFWYIGTAVPIIGLVQLGSQSIADRYTYIPMIGIALLVVWCAKDLSDRWRLHHGLQTTMATVALIACAIMTYFQIAYWKDSATAWSRAIAVTKNNFMAHYCLGNISWHTNPDLSLAEFQKSVELNPDYLNSQLGLGAQLCAHHDFWGGINHFEMAIRIEPQHSRAYYGLSLCFLQLGRAGDAVSSFIKAVELDPGNSQYKADLNQVLFFGSEKTETVSNLLEIARSDPKKFDNFLRAVELDTNQVDLINNLAWEFATYHDPKLRNGHHAIRLARHACEITGYQSPICVRTLAVAYAEDSRFDEAVSASELACSLASSSGQPELFRQNQELLKLFRSHQPFHETVQTVSQLNAIPIPAGNKSPP